LNRILNGIGNLLAWSLLIGLFLALFNWVFSDHPVAKSPPKAAPRLRRDYVQDDFEIITDTKTGAQWLLWDMREGHSGIAPLIPAREGRP
jgi:hypothetical protein